jgi:RNA polymerase sigma-70 factor (ECF subfamily)
VPEVLPFEEVYERYALDVYRFCLFQLKDPAAAEDVAADVFVSAFKAYPKAQPPEDEVRHWLIHIAKNATISFYRRANRLRRFLGGSYEAAHAQGADVESQVATNYQIQAVQRAMGQLSAKQRLLVSLRCAADLSYDEIGRITGMTSKAAAMATYRALEKIRLDVADSDA